jgi:DNA-binding transcriptional ArsR family regulator
MNNVEICSEESIIEHANKLKVCGHPLRLRLLCMIAREVNPCVSELWECLDQPQPVISQHLSTLKRHGIVTAEISGNKRIYSITDPFVQKVIKAMQ